MRIGLDIDGTITTHPDIFRVLCHKWMAAGDEVWIITGVGDPDARRVQLDGLGIERTSINIVDNGSPPEVLAPLKAAFCLGNGIDLMIDDMPEVVMACLVAGVAALLVLPSAYLR